MIEKKEFYFIRHGQIDYNTSTAKTDHVDVSLNAAGLKQAQDVEPLISCLPVKSICCSPLKRAVETKEIISPRLLAPHYEIQSLGECSSKIWNDMTVHGRKAFVKGDEHVRSFILRAVSGVNEALSLKGPPLLVAHAGIHWALCCILEINDHEWFIENCQPVHFFPDHQGQWRAKRIFTQADLRECPQTEIV